jgi:hypothetical protein
MDAAAEARVRADYSFTDGFVVASYPGTLRIATMGDGGEKTFRTAPALGALPSGHRVRVIALQGEDEARFVRDFETGQTLNASVGLFRVKIAAPPNVEIVKVLLTIALMIPFLGQFMALSAHFGGLAGMLASSSVKGNPPTNVPVFLGGGALYWVGVVVFFSQWFGGGHSFLNIGLLIMLGGCVLTSWIAALTPKAYMAGLYDLSRADFGTV